MAKAYYEQPYRADFVNFLLAETWCVRKHDFENTTGQTASFGIGRVVKSVTNGVGPVGAGDTVALGCLWEDVVELPPGNTVTLGVLEMGPVQVLSSELDHGDSAAQDVTDQLAELQNKAYGWQFIEAPVLQSTQTN